MSRSPQAGLGSRTCQSCGATFQPYREAQRSCSRKCREQQAHLREHRREYLSRPDVRERKNKQRRDRYADDPTSFKDATIRSRYGISLDDYERMFAEQGGTCAICHKPQSGGKRTNSRLHVDHDHETGAVRGLLCTHCNLGIGYFADRAELLTAAIGYLTTQETSA